MAKRSVNHKKANFWRKQIAEQASGGKSVAVFCRERRLAPCQFYWWKRELEKRGRDAMFVPVHVTEDISPSDTAVAPSKSDGGIEIVTASGSVVKVRPGFDGATLARVLKTLEAKPC